MYIKLVLLTAVLTILTGIASSQVRFDSDVTVSEPNEGSCEQNPSYVFILRHEMQSSGASAFVLFRSGTGERASVLNRRFNTLVPFLRTVGLKDKVIYARGEKVDGLGRIEFYLDGKLRLVIFSRKNQYPCMDCCPGFPP